MHEDTNSRRRRKYDRIYSEKILCQYEVIVAKDGKEGVEKFLTEKPDLVLMDIELPKMNGIDATKEIKKLIKCQDNSSYSLCRPKRK